MRIFFTSLLLLASFGVAANGNMDEGIALFDSEKYDEAKDWFGARSRKDSPTAQYWLGRIEMEAGKFKRAEKHFERATKNSPDTHEYVLWLGRAYGSRARDANMFTKGVLAPKIRDAFLRAVELKPDDIGSRENLIDFYLEAPGIMGGSTAKAREQAVEIGKYDAVAGVANDARVAQAEDGLEAALAVLEAGIDAHPNEAQLYVSAAMTAQRLENWDRSVELLTRAVERNPDAWGAVYQIGRAAEISGDNLDRGADALRRFIAEAPDDTGYPKDAPHVRLAQIYAHLDEPANAARHYEAALAANPDNKEAKQCLKSVAR